MLSFVRTPVLMMGLVLPLLATAQENDPPKEIDCGYPLNNAERTFCADKALAEAEAAMDEAYRNLQEKLFAMDAELPDHLKGSPEALAKAQLAWRNYRDLDCKAYGFPFQGGTRGNALFRSCMIILTRQRADDLSATIEDYGN
ncbi:lysozyme inhibitor LprI family protein [Roseibium sp.]|uniref:lysozyme inhibitor LprI family protein n=1 Tax=Roseibium sp. TaxID=1936156 RepID=UPI0025E1B912|nr:lysozyme inhibitor LprI family protein [Roseibium sp.]